MGRREKKVRRPPVPLDPMRLRAADWASAAALLVATFVLYIPALSCEFVEYDDDQYVTKNEVVQQGLSPATIKWAFTTTHFANWLPVTWLSHLLDVSLFGLNAGGHHATSALLHGVNAALVFLVVRRMTGFRWRSLAVALLFAVHPLRVESAVWIAERKDVLCGTFFLLTLWAYDAWVRRPERVGVYVAMCVFYALGLMAKTMIVTLPFLLLVLDVWPLRRVKESEPLVAQFARLLKEKIPLFVLCAIACAWTVALQKSGGATSNLAHLTPSQRLGNAAVSIPRYFKKIAWPTDLSALYPHPGSWPPSMVWASVALIVAITGGVVLLARRTPYLTVGWFWFLGMLAPVVGIIQAGLQSMADRYTYLPGIGLAVAVVWLVAETVGRSKIGRNVAVACLVVIVAVLSVATWRQQRVWTNTYTLMERMLAVTENNYIAQGHFAAQLEQRKDVAGAERHFAEAVRIKPDYLEGSFNWGNMLMRQGRPVEAAERYRAALTHFPNHADSHNGLGAALAVQGDFAGAEREFRAAVKLKPTADALVNLAASVRNQGRLEEAYFLYQDALKLDPNNARARRGMAEMRGTP